MSAPVPPPPNAAAATQSCVRCGARWLVRGEAMTWCPRCRFTLQAPVPAAAPAFAAAPHPAAATRPFEPGRRPRGYRWIARPPAQSRPKATRPARLGQTPRYRVIPQWGLPDPPPAPPTVDKGDAASAPRLLGYVAAAYLAAAAAEFGRYLILLRNRTRLIDPWLLRLSDLTVLACSLLALTLAVVTAVVCVRALTEIRRAVFDAAGRSDPRSARQIALWCLVPGLNLVGPGLLLTEPARLVAPRALRAVRIWWGAWVLSAGIALTAFLWRWADSLQAMANGVAFTALADLAAAGVAVTTLWVMRELKGRNLIGRSPIPTRRVPAVGPVRPVIAEVRPAEPGEPSDSTSSTGNDDADRTDGRAAQEAAAS